MGCHDAIMFVTSVSPLSPPAPSPTAASTNGPEVGFVPGVGVNPVGGGGGLETPFEKLRATEVGVDVKPSRSIAEASSVWLPSTQLADGSVKS